MLDLTWWQALALVGSAAAAVFGGRLLGAWAHRVLYRRVLLARSSVDDTLVLRLLGPCEAIGAVIVWQLLIGFGDYPPSVVAFCRNVGHIGLLLAIGWGAVRLIDTVVEILAHRSKWLTNQRASQTLVPLARRITKVVLGVVVGVMILSRLGYEVGPLLVLFAIVGGAVAIAARHPLENVLAAYAIIGDHGIREGDAIRLEGIVGVIDVIGMHSTRIKTNEGSYVILPNRKLADAQIERSAPRPNTRPLAVVPPPTQSTRAGGLS